MFASARPRPMFRYVLSFRTAMLAAMLSLVAMCGLGTSPSEPANGLGTPPSGPVVVGTLAPALPALEALAVRAMLPGELVRMPMRIAEIKPMQAGLGTSPSEGFSFYVQGVAVLIAVLGALKQIPAVNTFMSKDGLGTLAAAGASAAYAALAGGLTPDTLGAAATLFFTTFFAYSGLMKKGLYPLITKFFTSKD